MANVSFDYRSKKEVSKIEARFSFRDHSGKRRSLRTRVEIAVSAKFWKEYKKGTNFRDTDKANKKKEIDDLLSDLNEFAKKEFERSADIGKDWWRDTVKKYYDADLQSEAPFYLLEYLDYYLKLHKSTPSTLHKWMAAKKNLIDLESRKEGRKFRVSDVGQEFLREYREFMYEEGYEETTAKNTFQYVIRLCRDARINKVPTSEALDSLEFRITDEELPKVYLSFSELEKIQSLKNLPDRLDAARDWLIISCYTGQRISDFMRYRPEMIREVKGKKFIEVRQQKTGKEVVIPLMDEVLSILEKRCGYFPEPIAPVIYNKRIKEVCRLAGIDEPMKGRVRQKVKDRIRGITGIYQKWELIGSHVGRRSFATNYYGEVATTYLKNITGHSTETMLLRYIGKGSRDTAPKAFEQMKSVKK